MEVRELNGPLAFNYVVSVDTNGWEDPRLRRNLSEMFRERLLNRQGIGNTYSTTLKNIYCSDNSRMKNGVWCSQGKKSEQYTYIYYVSFIINPDVGLADTNFEIKNNSLTSTHSEWHKLGRRVILDEKFEIDKEHKAAVKDYREPESDDDGFNMNLCVESVGTDGIDTTMVEDKGFENTVNEIINQQKFEQVEPDADSDEVVDQFSSVVSDSLKDSVTEKLLDNGAVRLRGPTQGEMDSIIDMIIEVIESITSKELTYLKEKPEDWYKVQCAKCGRDGEEEMFTECKNVIREEIRNYMIDLNGLHRRDIYVVETSENTNDFLVDIDTGEIVFNKSMYLDLMTEVSNILKPICRNCHKNVTHDDYQDDQYFIKYDDTKTKSVDTNVSDKSSRIHYPVDNRMTLGKLKNEIYDEIAKRLSRRREGCQEELIRPEINKYRNKRNKSNDVECLMANCDKDVSCDEPIDSHHMNPLSMTDSAIKQTFNLEGNDCTVYINSDTRDIVFTQEAIREIEKIVENMDASTLFCRNCLNS